MAIKSKTIDGDAKGNYIFIENKILVKDDDGGSLPDISFLNEYISKGECLDYYSEDTTATNALFLKKESPVIKGLKEMPLRQYFWISKSDEDMKNFSLSKKGVLAARAHGFLSLRQNYRYCPKCGSPFTDAEKETALECTGCKSLLFPRIEPCIIVLVTKGDKILLVKNKIRNTFYSCVAGFVEHGESLEQCVAREVKEETNLTVKNIRYVTSQAWPFPDQLMCGFLADYESGEIKCQEEEIEDAAFFSYDDLPTIPTQGSIAYNLIMLLNKRQSTTYCHN